MDWVFLCLAGAGAGFYLISAAAVWLGLRGPRTPARTPPISILKPLREARPGLAENLASFCRQQYPDFQIVFGLGRESDPSFPIVQKIQDEFKSVDLRVVVKEPAIPRMANLSNMVERAKHDLILVSDDDVRVEPDFLQRLAVPLSEGQTGAVATLYFARPRGLPLHALTINLETLPFGLIGAGLGATVANGAALGIRRAALDKIGGFEAAADQAGDNFWIVRSVARAGYHVEVLDVAVEMADPGESWLRRQLRSDRTDRYLSPWLFAGRLLTHGVFWSALYAAVLPSELSLYTVISVLGLRLLSSAAIAVKLGVWSMIAWLWLVPIRDMLGLGLWAASWLGNTIEYHGARYRFKGGRRVKIA